MKKKKYYYAVKNGRHPGIYNTWEECKEEIIYYSNAVFKKFDNLEDAVEFTKVGPKKKDYRTYRIHQNPDGTEWREYMGADKYNLAPVKKTFVEPTVFKSWSYGDETDEFPNDSIPF